MTIEVFFWVLVSSFVFAKFLSNLNMGMRAMKLSTCNQSVSFHTVLWIAVLHSEIILTWCKENQVSSRRTWNSESCTSLRHLSCNKTCRPSQSVLPEGQLSSFQFLTISTTLPGFGCKLLRRISAENADSSWGLNVALGAHGSRNQLEVNSASACCLQADCSHTCSLAVVSKLAYPRNYWFFQIRWHLWNSYGQWLICIFLVFMINTS